MGVPVASRQTAPPQRADAQRSQSHPGAQAVVCRETSPLARLQRTVGNRAINRLLRSRTIQPKLTVSHPDDPYEREADRVSDEVMRMPGPTSLAVQRGPARIQRFCPECEKEQPARNATRAPMQISRMCTECEEKTHFRGTE